MSAITLQFTTTTERQLREQAGRAGLTLEDYLIQLAERSAGNGTHPTTDLTGTALSAPATSEAEAFPKFISRPQLTDAEFQQHLEALATGPAKHSLPADFSRADIYEDHH